MTPAPRPSERQPLACLACNGTGIIEPWWVWPPCAVCDGTGLSQDQAAAQQSTPLPHDRLAASGVSPFDLAVVEKLLAEAMIPGCSNSNCDIRRPKGQHTNGACHCLEPRDFTHETRRELRKRFAVLNKIVDALPDALAEITRLQGEVAALQEAVDIQAPREALQTLQAERDALAGLVDQRGALLGEAFHLLHCLTYYDEASEYYENASNQAARWMNTVAQDETIPQYDARAARDQGGPG